MRPSKYILEAQIGHGSFGQVFRALNTQDNKRYAIKILPKEELRSDLERYTQQEVEILKSISHRNIVKFFELIEADTYDCLVFELCNGGDLCHYLKSQGGRITESCARFLLKQMVEAITSLHELSIIHRDIKLSNFFLHFPSAKISDRPILKLGDFGFAKCMMDEDMIVFPDQELAMSQVGTCLTMAPEVLGNKPYSCKADIWSLGVVAYELLCGSHCFTGKSSIELKAKIDDGSYTIRNDLDLSLEAVDFISSCLQSDPKKRLNWSAIKNHPFFTDSFTKPASKMIKSNICSKYISLNTHKFKDFLKLERSPDI